MIWKSTYTSQSSDRGFSPTGYIASQGCVMQIILIKFCGNNQMAEIGTKCPEAAQTEILRRLMKLRMKNMG